MDSHVPEDAASAFAAILQDIYNQTKIEIEVESQFAAHHHEASPPFPKLSSQLQDETYRYEPLLDPAFSYIYDIQGDDNLLVANDPSFSYGELVSYQAKASELAAILKEDSPTLVVNLTSQEPYNPINLVILLKRSRNWKGRWRGFLGVEVELCAGIA